MMPNNLKQISFPLVLIVVPNRNGIMHLSYSLDLISKIEYPNFRVVVVDNCSEDRSVEYIQKVYPQFEIIRKESDTGFSGSVNKGLLYGLTIDAEYIVVFSNDVGVHPSWLSCSIKTAIKHPESGIIGFIEINGSYGNTDIIMPCEIKTSYQTRPDCAAIYIFRSKVIRGIGLYDELYYMYGEDDDIFYRSIKAGYKILQTNIPVWHTGEGFSNSLEKQRIMTRYVYRNWLRFGIKNLSLIGIGIVLVKMFIYALVPNIMFKKRRKKFRGTNRLIRFGVVYRLRCFSYSVCWNLMNTRETRLAKVTEYIWVRSQKQNQRCTSERRIS